MKLSFGAFEAASVVMACTAALAWLNKRWIKLPMNIGLTLLAALAAIAIFVADRYVNLPLARGVTDLLVQVDFGPTLLNAMLSFLLFAAAIRVDLTHFKRNHWLIYTLATAGVLLSMVLVGFGAKAMADWGHVKASLMWCLVFGALISPTDPVAVTEALERSGAPDSLKTTIAGESLLNDATAIVATLVFLAAAQGAEPLSPHEGLALFAREAFGGGLLGLALGWLAFVAIRAVDDYRVEVLVTLAVVMGGYTLSRWLHFSGPVCMALAGLVIGNRAFEHAMNDDTRRRVIEFWNLIDELLNAALYLLIGLVGIVLFGRWKILLLALAFIPLVMAARAASIALPLLVWRKLTPFRQAFPLLTWGGLRGGVSIALALSLPPGPMRVLILSATYVVVLFSVLVQSATIEPLVKRLKL